MRKSISDKNNQLCKKNIYVKIVTKCLNSEFKLHVNDGMSSSCLDMSVQVEQSYIVWFTHIQLTGCTAATSDYSAYFFIQVESAFGNNINMAA